VLRSADGSTRVATPLATPRDRSAATSVAGPSRRETWSELGSGVAGSDQLTNNFLLSLGVSFFLPSDVKVSR
jgi:hypothetical protein